ncbi:subtilisin-like protease SBT1.8 [Cryptomeria japonica]|uniref:subtilisin-like protease SBT1.8 n=1 Tax=Cryptomeria japonica TaxID=3369 RepID=UPI0025AB7002|nr:subtilisin-like protease SBT1.8 [Cryptomeria japonica]
MVAANSSRGPSKGYPHNLKPDKIGPGVNILEAYTGDIADYYIDSGTSIACLKIDDAGRACICELSHYFWLPPSCIAKLSDPPGVAALVKAIHPTWSPAAIKSALMKSSYTVDNAGQPIRDSYMEPANPFAMGARHVDPKAAVDPGLVYDMAPQDYINLLCSLNSTKEKIALLTKERGFCPKATLEAGDLNYPSFSVVFESGSKSVHVKRRRVTYVSRKDHAVYQVTVKNPPGVNISVKPRKLVFRKRNDTASYSVTFRIHLTSSDMKMGFGEIGWKCIEGGTQLVRSPIAIIW